MPEDFRVNVVGLHEKQKLTIDNVKHLDNFIKNMDKVSRKVGFTVATNRHLYPGALFVVGQDFEHISENCQEGFLRFALYGEIIGELNLCCWFGSDFYNASFEFNLDCSLDKLDELTPKTIEVLTQCVSKTENHIGYAKIDKRLELIKLYQKIKRILKRTIKELSK